jgi:hypothetical protein
VLLWDAELDAVGVLVCVTVAVAVAVRVAVPDIDGVSGGVAVFVPDPERVGVPVCVVVCVSVGVTVAVRLGVAVTLAVMDADCEEVMVALWDAVRDAVAVIV